MVKCYKIFLNSFDFTFQIRALVFYLILPSFDLNFIMCVAIGWEECHTTNTPPCCKWSGNKILMKAGIIK